MTIGQGNLLSTLRERYSDPLLTVLTALLLFLMFVVAPLQASGIVVFQAVGVFAALAMMTGVLILSGSAIAAFALSVAISMNVFVIILRLRGDAVGLRPSHGRRGLAGSVDYSWCGRWPRSLCAGCGDLSPYRRGCLAVSLDCPGLRGAVRFCLPSDPP